MNKILNYKETGSGPVLMILHGLFGSLDNWQTLAKRFAASFRCITVDLRNHGRSFHDPVMNYPLMAEDVKNLMQHLQLPKASVLGHSMGGKTAMQLAFMEPACIASLIISDITPAAYSEKHNDVILALKNAPLDSNDRMVISDHLMNRLNDDAATVMFLMKGLQRKEGAEGFQWKFNLEAIAENYPQLSGAVTGTIPFSGPTLFLKGSRSGYIVPDTYATIPDLFPNHQLDEIRDAGHWIHAEQPDSFFNSCMQFLREH